MQNAGAHALPIRVGGNGSDPMKHQRQITSKGAALANACAARSQQNFGTGAHVGHRRKTWAGRARRTPRGYKIQGRDQSWPYD